MDYKSLYGTEIEKDGHTFTIDLIYCVENDKYMVKAKTGETFSIVKSKLDEALKNLSDQSAVTIIKTNPIASLATGTFQNMEAFNDIMKDSIKKLQDDPNYIPQAQAINQTVMTMLEAAKTQVEIMKLMKG